MNNHVNYRKFLEKFQKRLHFQDKENIIIKALANVIRRTIILINSTEIDPEKQMIKTNQHYGKITPPIILGIYQVNEKWVFLPYFLYIKI